MSFVTTEIQDAVAVLTIDRPKALNALNPEVLARFEGRLLRPSIRTPSAASS